MRVDMAINRVAALSDKDARSGNTFLDYPRRPAKASGINSRRGCCVSDAELGCSLRSQVLLPLSSKGRRDAWFKSQSK
jgi:hypothetical protein